MTGADHFLLRVDPGPGDGPLLAVKDLVDVAGLPTTCGCRAVAQAASPAKVDAGCVESARRGGARIVGKTALHELAYGVSGENPWYGTPENPLDAGRVPGGSSSGSAVAVAVGDAVVAIGTDTGGSIRIPAACCGVVGLKTTFGALALDGVRPLAPSFDTVGPMGATVAAVARGWELLGGGPPPGSELVEAAQAAVSQGRIGRLRGLERVDLEIDVAVDAALAACELSLETVRLESWEEAFRAHRVLLAAEAFAVDGPLLAGASGAGVGDEVRAKLLRGAHLPAGEVEGARQTGHSFRGEVLDLLRLTGVLALPTIPCPPPALGEPVDRLVWLTAPVNLLGFPALSVPVPLPEPVWSGGRTSLQLVGPPGSEPQLLELGSRLEQAVA
jgi:amidase